MSYAKRATTSGEPRHLRIYEWLWRSPAWRSLDVYERALYLEFKARYMGNNNGNISFSGSEMEAALNCSNGPADRALRTLIEKGFLKVSQRGHFDWKNRRDGSSRATTYVLTEFSVDWPERSAMPPTKEFMKWRAPEPQTKQRGDAITSMRVSGHRNQRGMRVAGHPNKVTTSPDKQKSTSPNAVSASPAYSIPDEGHAARLGAVVAKVVDAVSAKPAVPSNGQPPGERGRPRDAA